MDFYLILLNRLNIYDRIVFPLNSYVQYRLLIHIQMEFLRYQKVIIILILQLILN